MERTKSIISSFNQTSKMWFGVDLLANNVVGIIPHTLFYFSAS